jgi:hypothetical protein
MPTSKPIGRTALRSIIGGEFLNSQKFSLVFSQKYSGSACSSKPGGDISTSGIFISQGGEIDRKGVKDIRYVRESFCEPKFHSKIVFSGTHQPVIFANLVNHRSTTLKERIHGQA